MSGNQPRPQWRISTLWVLCLLALMISLVTAVPVVAINAISVRQIGTGLITEVSRQQFTVLYFSLQSALDEADYWMEYIDGWMRQLPLTLEAAPLEPLLVKTMLPWINSVANRVGGVCVGFLNDRNANKTWLFCASRLELSGVRQLFWEHTTSKEQHFATKTRVDKYGKPLEDIETWPVELFLGADDTLEDGAMQWLPPWIWTETHPNGESFTFTEVGQTRMTRVDRVPIANFLWMQDVDWAKLLREGLTETGSDDPSAVAFLIATSGTLIATTCGASHSDKGLLPANESDCAIVRLTFQALERENYRNRTKVFFTCDLDGILHSIGVRRIITSHGDLTPYFITLAYPYSSLDQPLRINIMVLVLVSLSIMAGVTGASFFLANHVIAAPLRDIARNMYRCVELDISTAVHYNTSPILELFSIIDSFAKMKATLDTVTKFVPMEVVQRSLRFADPVTMSMTPTKASVFFLDIRNFTHLTETVETGFLVESIAIFFEVLSNIIVQHEGVIDKYIGDCVMAFWNTPQLTPDHEFLACSAALRCAETMEEASTRTQRLHLTGRIGLEAGAVHAGMFGSRHRMNYTVVGDVVNVAARLESLNKLYETTILMGSQMHDAVQQRVRTRRLPGVEVRGKAEKMVVYELLGLTQPPDSSAETSFCLPATASL